MFGLFGGSKEDRDVKRLKNLGKRSQETYGDPSVRRRALAQLRELGTPEAISVLLQRFTVKVEPGITDLEEKEEVFEMIVGLGEPAVEPLEAYLRKSDIISWGLRCLVELVPPEQTIATLTSILDRLAREYSRDPEKKVVILNHLADLRDPRIVPAALPFLDDLADEVKIAAMTTITQQEDPSAVEPLARTLANAEAPRVRAAAAQALATLGAPLGAARALIEGSLPSGFQLDREGILRKG